MSLTKFRIHYLLLYFILASLFLFISGNVGQYLVDTQDVNRQLAMFLQGMIFTGLTLITLFILKRKNSKIFKYTGLTRFNFSLRGFIGVMLPFILLILGMLTAYLFGGIENIKLNLTLSTIFTILINSITAFVYEAFPEEVFVRGLIFEELHKKFNFIIALILQPLIFICIPILAITLNYLFLNQPFTLTIDYFILLYMFGLALQLYKQYTGSLWMSIIFHIIYLEIARYISVGGMSNSDTSLFEFTEVFEGFMILYLSFIFIVVLSIVVLSILLLIEKRAGKYKI